MKNTNKYKIYNDINHKEYKYRDYYEFFEDTTNVEKLKNQEKIEIKEEFVNEND